MPGVNAGVRVLSDAGVCCWFICKRGGADLQIVSFPLGIMPILFPFGKNEELEAAE